MRMYSVQGESNPRTAMSARRRAGSSTASSRGRSAPTSIPDFNAPDNTDLMRPVRLLSSLSILEPPLPRDAPIPPEMPSGCIRSNGNLRISPATPAIMPTPAPPSAMPPSPVAPKISGFNPPAPGRLPRVFGRHPFAPPVCVVLPTAAAAAFAAPVSWFTTPITS